MTRNLGNRMRGEKHHRAKLTDAQVARIRRRYRPGLVGYVELGREEGCSPWTVRDIVKGWTRTRLGVEKLMTPAGKN